MSTQPENKSAVRSKESLLAELLICKKLGWEIGFVSGGIGSGFAGRLIELPPADQAGVVVKRFRRVLVGCGGMRLD